MQKRNTRPGKRRSLGALLALGLIASSTGQAAVCPCVPGPYPKPPVVKDSWRDTKGGVWTLTCTNQSATGDFVWTYQARPGDRKKTIGRCIFVGGQNSTHPVYGPDGNVQSYVHVCRDGGDDDGAAWDAVVNVFDKATCKLTRYCLNRRPDGTWYEVPRDRRVTTAADFNRILAMDVDANGDSIPDAGLANLTEGMYDEEPEELSLPSEYVTSVNLYTEYNGGYHSIRWNPGRVVARVTAGDFILLNGVSMREVATVNPNYQAIEVDAGLILTALVDFLVEPEMEVVTLLPRFSINEIPGLGQVPEGVEVFPNTEIVYSIVDEGANEFWETVTEDEETPMEQLGFSLNLDIFDFPGAIAGMGNLDLRPRVSHELSFDAPEAIHQGPGPLSLEVEARLETFGAGDATFGVEAWSLSVLGMDVDIVSATTAGTAGADANDPVGQRRNGFEFTELTSGEPINRGVISAVILDLVDPVSLDPRGGPASLLRMTIESRIPEGEDCSTGALRFLDGLRGSGDPVLNRLTVKGASTIPTVFDHSIRFCPCPTEGDTHALDLDLEPVSSADPGVVVARATAIDLSDDPITYLFSATNSHGDEVRLPPQSNPEARLDLGPGAWDVCVEVDDDLECPDTLDSARSCRVVDTGGAQLPGDLNQDGNLDVSDAVAGFELLFLGREVRLPCGDGSSRDPRNVALIDANGDARFDLSDGVSTLRHLFTGGNPHVLGTDCVALPGCPSRCER